MTAIPYGDKSTCGTHGSAVQRPLLLTLDRMNACRQALFFGRNELLIYKKRQFTQLKVPCQTVDQMLESKKKF